MCTLLGGSRHEWVNLAEEPIFKATDKHNTNMEAISKAKQHEMLKKLSESTTIVTKVMQIDDSNVF